MVQRHQPDPFAQAQASTHVVPVPVSSPPPREVPIRDEWVWDALWHGWWLWEACSQRWLFYPHSQYF